MRFLLEFLSLFCGSAWIDFYYYEKFAGIAFNIQTQKWTKDAYSKNDNILIMKQIANQKLLEHFSISGLENQNSSQTEI